MRPALRCLLTSIRIAGAVLKSSAMLFRLWTKLIRSVIVNGILPRMYHGGFLEPLMNIDPGF